MRAFDLANRDPLPGSLQPYYPQDHHFFRHNGPGGVIVVPWGSPHAFFHIGRGGQDPSLRDLRCHLLDRHRRVQQTFTVATSGTMTTISASSGR